MQWTIYIHKFTALKFLEPGNRPHFPFFLHKFIISVLNRKVWHFDTVFHKKTLRLSQSFFCLSRLRCESVLLTGTLMGALLNLTREAFLWETGSSSEDSSVLSNPSISINSWATLTYSWNSTNEIVHNIKTVSN